MLLYLVDMIAKLPSLSHSRITSLYAALDIPRHRTVASRLSQSGIGTSCAAKTSGRGDGATELAAVSRLRHPRIYEVTMLPAVIPAIAMLAFAGQAPPEGVTPTLIRLPPSAVVDAVNCDEWERLDNRWRTGRGAHVDVSVEEAGGGDSTIHIAPGDVTARSDNDLFFTLELTCRSDIGGGIWDKS